MGRLLFACSLAFVCSNLVACKSSGDDDTAGSGGTGIAGSTGTGGMTAGTGGMTAGTGGTTGGTGGMTAGTGGMTAGSGGGMSAPTDPTFSAIYANILTKGAVGNCTFGGCHGAAADDKGNGNLHMVATDRMATYMALVGPQSTGTLCTGMMYVVPFNADASLLMLKLRPSPPCGMRMPLVPLGRVLTDAELTQIATWINNGAMNN